MDKWHLPLLADEHLEFTRPTWEGAEYIAANLRAADRAEGFATFGDHQHMHALRLSMIASDDCVMAVNAYGIPVALLGVSTVSALYGIGSPWLLGTDDTYRYRRAFIRLGRAYTRAMLNEYEVLENFVDARNTQSIAWLRHLGYRIEPAVPFGALGMPFHPFRIER